MIFVGGLSGSGKTSMIRNLVSRIPEYTHIQASAILRSIDRPIEGLTLDEAIENQAALADWIAKLSNVDRKRAILDGHGILIVDDAPLQVPFEFFNAIGLSRIVLITGEPSLILKNRTWPASLSSPEAIALLQEIEAATLRDVSKKLGVDMHGVNSGDLDRLYQVFELK
ncbi:hypothetical protein CK222_03450 [Mesorhizobium sp. WSM3866]|uniref:AAA family ATPase n=1 Tax=Mesorhizobium sp. WSM3866 TaxID=422271 RepID=UPI000BAE7AB8|nr:AAA family ATPase [Mesorhizobium sp. WSM3866]PBB45544.1 hypothetical protein CK222_03450 [Mesorhizobium sp. WSM3866]